MNAQWVQTTSSHTKIKNLLVTYNPLSQQRIDRIQPEYVFDKHFTVCIPNRQD